MDDNNHLRTRRRRKSASRFNDDDVFSSPALVSPSEEIYSEIFAGFHGGVRGRGLTIPVLDLPPVDERNYEELIDFRFVDYSEVFGGFEGMVVDYAVPFHELFSRSNGGYASSSDGAWTPVVAECMSEEWDGSSYSSKCRSFENDSNQQLADDANQFNMSYQRKHQSNESVSNTQLAPVHAIPGYAVVIGQGDTSQKIGLQSAQLLADDDDDKLIIREQEEKLSHCETVDNVKVDVCNASDEMYITISDINLRTQANDGPPPSRPPPSFGARYENTVQANSSVSATCGSKHLSRSIAGNNSPPFVDVEVDPKFSAADSARCLTESVKKSQATLNATQEEVQNKNAFMRQVNVRAKDETEFNVAVRKSHYPFNDLQHQHRKGGSSTSNSAKSSPDVMEQNPMLNLSGKKKSKQSWSSEESYEARSSGEWVKVPGFIEHVRSEKTKIHKQDSGEYTIVHNSFKEGGKEERRTPKHEGKINKRVSITSGKLEDLVKISEAVAVNEEMARDEKCKALSVSLRTTHRCKEGEGKVHVEDQQMEDDINIDIKKNEHETVKELNEAGQKAKFDKEKTEDARKLQEVGPKESSVAAEDDQRVRRTCEIQLRNLSELAHQTEGVMNSTVVDEKQDPYLKGGFKDEENNKIQKKFDEKEHEEKQLKEITRTSREISHKEEYERRKKEEEYVAKLMEASENEAEDLLKEALEEVNKRILMDDFERAEKEKKLNNDAEQPCNKVKEPNMIKKKLRDPNLMTGDWKSSNPAPDVDITVDATHHGSCITKQLKEENIRVLYSVSESDQDEVTTVHEVNTVVGEKSNYKLSSDVGASVSKYITATGTNGYLSATKEYMTLPNGTNMSSDISGKASLHKGQVPKYQCGFKISHKVPSMAPNSTNLQEKVKVGKESKMENAQGQDKVTSNDEFDIDKDKVPQKPDRETGNDKKSDLTNFHLSDGRKQTSTLSQQSKTSQIVGGKDNCRNDGIASQERAKLERERRAREIELERLREMEEEWEREREREKDRVAFEGVTQIAGLRHTASMNNVTSVEARQKDFANARGRLERSSSEAKEKLFSNKKSMEARMRQDQSAVKIANTEAQERADRSLSYNSTVCPSTSVFNDGGHEGESAQRFKARLERQQRTAERAAKALAEKNTRDVIAQREQAERHRLAESLDAEVKRWAYGKQGNLRALLSTLQYILGAESGWQPVPLTDIITSVAVKKAYRKATLCVHPDKLQQRRATIHQKYICEKVFDLLKEAWNRFNSEER